MQTDPILKLMCGKCGHRELGRLLVSATGVRLVKDRGAGTLSIGAGMISPKPEPFITKGLDHETLRRMTRQSETRVKFICHGKCGAKPIAHSARLSVVARNAVAKGRSVVWLPNDL